MRIIRLGVDNRKTNHVVDPESESSLEPIKVTYVCKFSSKYLKYYLFNCLMNYKYLYAIIILLISILYNTYNVVFLKRQFIVST